MEGSFSATFGLVTLAMVVIGIASSHALRLFFKEWHWLDMSVGRLFLRMVMGAVALGAVLLPNSTPSGTMTAPPLTWLQNDARLTGLAGSKSQRSVCGPHTPV